MGNLLNEYHNNDQNLNNYLTSLVFIKKEYN